MKVQESIENYKLTTKGDFRLSDTLKKASKKLKDVKEGQLEEIIVSYDNYSNDKRLLLRLERLSGKDQFVAYYYQMVGDNIGFITAEVLTKKLIKGKTIKDALEIFYDWSLRVI